MPRLPRLRNPLTQKKRAAEVFTGQCHIRCFTGDGDSIGRCYHSTYNGVCPTHGDVSRYLENFGWPRDFELPQYDGSPWAEELRERYKPYA